MRLESNKNKGDVEMKSRLRQATLSWPTQRKDEGEENKEENEKEKRQDDQAT